MNTSSYRSSVNTSMLRMKANYSSNYYSSLTNPLEISQDHKGSSKTSIYNTRHQYGGGQVSFTSNPYA